MGPHCEILFEDNPSRIYYAGQTMSGMAILDLNENTRIRKMELIIEGYGECQWQESREIKNNDGSTKTEYDSYHGYQQYLNSVTLLVPTESHIPPGRHTYNFMLQIPPTTPSSMNLTNGHIVYRVVLNLDRPWNFDVKFNQEFIVICPINVDANPAWNVPCHQEEVKQYCCLFCASPPVIFNAKIPKTAYYPGEQMFIDTSVSNPSNVTISHLEVRLVKHIIYESQTPCHNRHYEDVVVYNQNIGEEIVNRSKDFQYMLLVPDTSPSTINYDYRVITVNYELKIKAKTRGCHSSPQITIPIIIGTVPMIDQMQPSVTVQPPMSVPMIMPNQMVMQNTMNMPNSPVMPVYMASAPAAEKPSTPFIPPVNSGVYPPAIPPAYNPSAPLIPPNAMNETNMEPNSPSIFNGVTNNLPPIDKEGVKNYNSTPMGFVVPGTNENLITEKQ
jgi:hypothetical protein